jgi:hypothetical protein
MAKIVSREGGRPARRPLDPIIVTRRGKIARLETSLTPHEAQIEDLVFIRKVLARADIPYLLIRKPKSRPILAINIELRPAVQRALVAACGTEPMYAKTLDEKGISPVLIAKARSPRWPIRASCGCIAGGLRRGACDSGRRSAWSSSSGSSRRLRSGARSKTP